MPPQVVGLKPAAVVIDGRWFTTTFTVPGNELQLFTVATTLYNPPKPTTALNLIEFCKLDVNVDGPVQA